MTTWSQRETDVVERCQRSHSSLPLSYLVQKSSWVLISHKVPPRSIIFVHYNQVSGHCLCSVRVSHSTYCISVNRQDCCAKAYSRRLVVPVFACTDVFIRPCVNKKTTSYCQTSMQATRPSVEKLNMVMEWQTHKQHAERAEIEPPVKES